MRKWWNGAQKNARLSALNASFPRGTKGSEQIDIVSLIDIMGTTRFQALPGLVDEIVL